MPIEVTRTTAGKIDVTVTNADTNKGAATCAKCLTVTVPLTPTKLTLHASDGRIVFGQRPLKLHGALTDADGAANEIPEAQVVVLQGSRRSHLRPGRRPHEQHRSLASEGQAEAQREVRRRVRW